MINFDFNIRTKLYFGEGKKYIVGDLLKEYNVKKVAIVFGRGFVRSSGLLDIVLKSLDDNGISYLLLEGVRPNPTRQLADRFVLEVKKYNPDFILAIGGGSVIDTAKYTAVGYYYDGSAFDFNLNLKLPEKALPIGVLLTISAAGSEMSTSCVVQDDTTMIKRGYNSSHIRPMFAIEDPSITYHVNKFQTGCGIVDMMMHTLERYFQPSEVDYELADNLAIAVLKSVKEAGKIVIEDPNNYQGRATLMLSSTLSHNGLTHIGKPFFMPVHQLEHALSGVYPQVAHGAGLSILFPAWAEFFLDLHTHKLARLGRELFDVKIENDKLAAKEAIKCFRNYFDSIGMPTYLEDCQIDNLDIDKLVAVLTDNGKKVIKDGEKIINKENARIIYESSLRRL